MGYRVGDKVRVRDNLENSSVNGKAYYMNDKKSKNSFVSSMRHHCGEVVTISKILDDGQYEIEEDHGYHSWVDEMFYGLVERTKSNANPSWFTKKDVKTGMFGKMRNGSLFVMVDGYLVYQRGGFDKLENMEENLGFEGGNYIEKLETDCHAFAQFGGGVTVYERYKDEERD